MAQYGWALSEEAQKKARKELNEYPEQKPLNLNAMREQMRMRPDISKFSQ